MSDATISTEATVLHSDQAAGQMVCPVCGREAVEGLLSFKALSDNLKVIVAANAPSDVDAVCRRCVEMFERARIQLEEDSVIFEQGGHVLSTPLRMDADERFTGRGVTIAFLDSGFYAHPDLTKPTNRIVAYKSIFSTEGDQTSLETNDVASWHGMMTSVVAAGNGQLAGGFYRGIASDAKLVLVKVGRTGRISEAQIQKGLEWVLEHAAEFKIGIVNISAGGDFEESYLTNSLSQTAERCTR